VQAQDAILVPQQAISRDSRGNATALVVSADSKAELREIVAERTVGDRWLVSRGLHSGDKVIVEGLGRIQPGQTVKPVAVKAPQG
jgi:membrane fusion protein (multidrug efflux system)